MDRLKGKRALITGGTSGIGLETARQFLSEGASPSRGKNPATLEAARKEKGDRVPIIRRMPPYFLIQALLPIFANPASIVLNASVNAHIGMPDTSVYGASKAALLSLARTLSGELIARGIGVNAVSPGPISTPLYGKLGLSEADLSAVAASIRSQVPAGRFGKPSEIAHAVVFLAPTNPRSRWQRNLDRWGDG